ncbi:MAG: class I SAM-dependent methyltransferase [Prolixibacteraceae bacterium]|nr:class I SAM-dependent methyltransferase [Prolixibacteraceae bacterium]
MKLIATDDFVETWCKIKQRGLKFILSKFTADLQGRTKSAFDTYRGNASDWWDVPQVRKRWNRMVTGNPNILIDDYVVSRYFSGFQNIKLLSPGSGDCSHEIFLAQHSFFEEITCIDIAENLLEKARMKSEELKLSNLRFICDDVYKCKLPQEYFDVIWFNASLHHFRNQEHFVACRLKPLLRENGLLIINEYVGPNRLQFSRKQINAINVAISKIDREYRIRNGSTLVKNHYSGSGLLRMYLADPSECVDSGSIISVIRRNFQIVEEKPFGGNILMAALKDIAHHFMETNPRKLEILDDLFRLEDEFLKDNPSDYMIGVYRKQTR